MRTPVKLNFDYEPGAVLAPGIAHIPKIYQGAPYSQAVGLRNETTGGYRDFTEYDDIVMQARTSQLKEPIFEASVTGGTIIATAQGIRFELPATATDSVTAPSNTRPGVIMQVPFVFDVELVQDGAVVERFAQGTGFVVINTTLE